MNAPARNLMEQVAGQLLHVGYPYDDGLLLDLYGRNDEDGYTVESIAVSGTTVEIGQLFSRRKLQNIGYWLDLKDGGPIQRQWAERHRHHAAAYTD